METKTDHAAYPGWRSLLFIPVHVDKFVAKAHSRGADAYILDLEDSVPLAEKELARTKVVNAAKQVSVEGAAALVRINLDEEMAMLDLQASIDASVAAIVIPKVESAEQVISIATKIDKLERERGIESGHTLLIAMIESVEALPRLDEIASANPRVISITLGSEDFSASAGMHSIPETLLMPNQMIAYACRRAGISPLGFPGSIADYSDIEAFRKTVQFANQLGFVGAFCIHPKQAAILNEELMPSADAIEHARGLIDAFEKGLAEGRGAVEFKGKMIDMPVVISARELIARFEKINGCAP
ncbi:HpcH/HpaI aldolase/citrate lyase family protein [Alkalimarinus sediminis]|uniref:CoA ester lyase n=1 Tax=Alkalimarinus sediminis TaxID=1632866 RepID=A0A9E8HL51_9ALTE|nr:CoA ester lyase [Alkalimarinus sediminis]UZW76464.1 CoA ester lyase [Alkalimarinus sediminis]